MNRNLSTCEVARILGMRESRVRELVRWGVCRPLRSGRRYAFSFQDLVMLRTARGLLEAKVPPARIRQALAALSAELPPGRALSGMRLQADGRRVVVCDGDSSWHPETGQTLLDLDLDDLAKLADDASAAPTTALAERRREDEAANGRGEFERGLELEDEDPKAACEAYARALELDPTLVDAYVNLGRLSHELGDAPEAMRLYYLALEHAPADPIIHFNLAVALEDAHGPEAAAAHYERALELDPDFADAHFNLAGLCEQLGRTADALRHYRAYKKLSGL